MTRPRNGEQCCLCEKWFDRLLPTEMHGLCEDGVFLGPMCIDCAHDLRDQAEMRFRGDTVPVEGSRAPDRVRWNAEWDWVYSADEPPRLLPREDDVG